VCEEILLVFSALHGEIELDNHHELVRLPLDLTDEIDGKTFRENEMILALGRRRTAEGEKVLSRGTLAGVWRL
jgi:hypothetical protein